MKFSSIRNIVILSSLVLISCQTEEIRTDDAPEIKTEGFAKEESTLADDVKAYKTILNLVKETGLDQNFMIVPSEVPYAKSYLEDNSRYLAYNPEFIDLVFNPEDSLKNWVAIGKLAHEIGHHLSKHELVNGEATPAEILEADKYSGFVYYKLGASMDTALAAMEQMIDLEPTKNNIPPTDSRLNAMAIGYNDALTLDQKVDTMIEESLIAIANAGPKVKDSDVPLDTPVHTFASNKSEEVKTEESSETEDANGLNFVYKCVLARDSSVFYVDQNDQIASFSNEKFLVVGFKTNSNKPGFEWVFEANEQRYGVDAKGRMWSRGVEGRFVIIGQVYKM